MENSHGVLKILMGLIIGAFGLILLHLGMMKSFGLWFLFPLGMSIFGPISIIWGIVSFGRPRVRPWMASSWWIVVGIIALLGAISCYAGQNGFGLEIRMWSETQCWSLSPSLNEQQSRWIVNTLLTFAGIAFGIRSVAV